LFIITETVACSWDQEAIMQTKRFIADVTLADGAGSFKVDRLTMAGIDAPAVDLLDPGVIYADREALQMVIAGKLRVEFPNVHVSLK
jgi:hypothetical protein